jgi:hypothetical protein
MRCLDMFFLWAMEPEKEIFFINTLGSGSMSVAARVGICPGDFETLVFIGGVLGLF